MKLLFDHVSYAVLAAMGLAGSLAIGAEKFEDPVFVPPPQPPAVASATNAYRILFVGNSITRHGIALDPYKWDHVAGMAASHEDKDFVHLLAARIQGTLPGRRVEIYFDNVNALLQRASSADPIAGKPFPPPHLVVIQTGEHEGPNKSKEEVARIYEDFIVRPYRELTPRPQILCVGLWNVSDGAPYGGWVRDINDAYGEVCARHGIPFVSVERLATDPSCRGWGEHPGVRWHPNDKGMQGYADLLFAAYQRSTAVPDGCPIFLSEDFSDRGALDPRFKIDASQWEIADHVLKTVGGTNRMLQFSIGETNWLDFEVAFKVKRIRLNPKDQHFGLFMRSRDGGQSGGGGSLRFYSEGSQMRFLETVGGREIRHDTLGPLPEALAVGEASPWTAFRFTLRGGQARAYMDDRLIGTLERVVAQPGKIQFYAYNLDLHLDAFRVVVMKTSVPASARPGEDRNILSNSGFEHCTLDRLPDYWGCLHWGIVDPYWVVNFAEWVERYGVDAQVAFEGKQSMRISNPFDKPDSSALCLRSVVLGVQTGLPHVFSGYLRSEPAGMKVSFNGREIVLTNTWRRYSHTSVHAGAGQDTLTVYPLGKGTFWIDAVQLEEGETPTEYRGRSSDASLQTQEGNVDKVITEVSRCEPRRMDGRITVDGRLDEGMWEGVERLNLVKINGQPAAEATEARICYDPDGLYVGITCFDENARSNVCKVLQREGTVWDDPSIELFLDPKLTRNYYYHLGLNQAGIQYDAFCGDISWNGAWQAATYTDPAGKYWSAEVFLPFGEMGLDRSVGEWLGLNVCRSNPRRNEYSAWSPTYGGFHTPERFGQVRIDPGVVAPYCLACPEARLTRLTDDTFAVVVQVVNNTGSEGAYRLEAVLDEAAGGRRFDFQQSVALARDESKEVVLGEIAAGAGAQYAVRLSLVADDGRKLHADRRRLEIPGFFELFTQYSLYTDESDLAVKAIINMDEAALRGARLELAVREAAGGTVSTRECAPLSRCTDVTVDIADLADGSYLLSATLKNEAGKALASLQKPFRKMPPVPYAVKVDHFSRMAVVGGKPFMPLGFCWEGEVTLDVLAYLARNGVNSVVVFPHGNIAKTQALLDDAAKTGIWVRLALDAKDKEQTVAFVERFKRHAALLAWDIFDEAFTVKWGKDHYPLIVDRCAEIKAVDPYHPVFINENEYGLNYLNSKGLAFPGDIVSIDYYAWTPAANLAMTARHAQLMESMGRADGRPGWIYLLGAGYAFWASRDLTPAEHEVSAYVSLVNGVSGVYYFASHPKSASAWERIRGLFREFKALTPVIASTEPTPTVRCTAPSIEFLVKAFEGTVYVMACNITEQAMESVTFTLPAGIQYAGEAEVMFESRKLEVRDGRYTDSFPGHSRHVYKVRIHGNTHPGENHAHANEHADGGRAAACAAGGCRHALRGSARDTGRQPRG